MNNIEQKALALINEILKERSIGGDCNTIYRATDATDEALCRAIEQHEAFRQEVSDAVGDALFMAERHCECDNAYRLAGNRLGHLIIPKPKPEPDALVSVLLDMELSSDLQEGQHDAKWIRNKLDALGFEIREKSQ